MIWSNEKELGLKTSSCLLFSGLGHFSVYKMNKPNNVLASQLISCGFASQFFCIEFGSSSCALVDFLQMLGFHHTDEKHACLVNLLALKKVPMDDQLISESV